MRAISSTKIEAVGAEQVYVKMVENAKQKNRAAGSLYAAIANDSNYMPSLATMMGLYMTARMNPSEADLSNPTCAIEDVQNLRDMYAVFLDAFDAEADAMAALVNLQLFLLKGEGSYTPYTAEMIYATTTARLKEEGIQITDLEQFVKDKNTIASDLVKLESLCSSGTSLTWNDSGLNAIVNNLVNVGACTIGADNTPISSIGASNAMGYLSGTQEAKITNGILYRFEERTGEHINVRNLSISATVRRSGFTVPATVKVNISTTASKDYCLFNNDMNYAKSLNNGDYKGGIAVAQDTYGLAIDLWVRTNAQASYLMLEGNILTESEEVAATGKDANGNTVDIYTITRTVEDEDGSSASFTTDLYKIETKDADENVTTTWYKANSHTEFTLEDGETPAQKMETVVTVIGYEGENRVWNGNSSTLLSTDSTTQGSGSCYVYYADTPEDQARSLKLLEAFNVAFVDGNGKLMATASMDTEHYYAVSGRVIVPLVLSTSDSISLGEDYEGNMRYAITALEKNTPTRVTAIVYLDGTKLTNDDVLSAADIQGQLNIQFGSSIDLNSIRNETLENAERSVSASVSETSFDYDTATEPMKTTVTINVSGEEPNTVTAFFLRQINSTQGSREKAMIFTKNEDGAWVADHTFTAPGNYVLRSVQLDGQDYLLASCPTVEITGFAIESLTCDQATNNNINIMTAANSGTVNLRLKFAADDASKLPKTVQGRFLREDGTATNINFTYNATTGYWNGSATFLTSGDYTLQYLVLDGNYAELPSTVWQTATVTLGMRVAVYTTSPWSFKYVPSEMTENQMLLGMQVKIMDNTGEEMPGLTDVKLVYGMKGSGIKTMDTDLEWNGTYYVGNLKTLESGGPGIWQFSTVTVGGNTITNATTSPTFTIMSPEPPEYYDHGTTSYQYKPNNDAVMNAQITNSAAASVQAYIIKEGATEGTWVDGVIGGELTTTDGKTANQWYFTVPKDANGYQDGNWQLTALKLWDVFDADGNAYTEEEPLEIDVSDESIETKVVNRVFVTFAEDKSQNFGKDASGNVTGAFMDSYTISGLNVDIKDFAGDAVSGITDVQLKFTYVNGSSQTYGGYTSNSLTNATEGATITVVLTDDGSGTHFVQTADATILYAGAYTTELSFKVSGTPYTYTGDKDDSANGTKALPANVPVFTVSSVVPTVKITGVTPTTSSYSVDLNTSGQLGDSSTSESQSRKTRYYWITNSSHVSGYSSSYTSTVATIYFKCDHTDDAHYGYTNFYILPSTAWLAALNNVDYHEYTQPTVTIAIADMGNATSAELSFGDGAYIFESRGGSTSTTTTFSWSSDGAAVRYIGIYTDNNNDDDAKTVAGTITATELILTHNGQEYKVPVTITINNPY